MHLGRRASRARGCAPQVDDRPVSTDLAGLDSTMLACVATQRGPVAAVAFADERLRDDDLAFTVRTAATCRASPTIRSAERQEDAMPVAPPCGGVVLASRPCIESADRPGWVMPRSGLSALC